MENRKETSTQDLFVELSSKLPIESRSHVPLLGARYDVYKRALATLLDEWLVGKVGHGQPTASWELDLIRDVNKQVNGEPVAEMDTETAQVYEALLKLKVPSHFRIVTSHRQWLQKTLAFCQIIGIDFSFGMDDLIRIHDLSKYTHREALGYAVMFGDGRNSFRVLEDPDEKQEWQITLHNHYAANPHHPEYFGRPEAGHQQTSAMCDLSRYRRAHFLEESVIDMLASHGERDLASDETFSVQKWMDINPKFLGRYEAEDRSAVQEMLRRWCRQSEEYLSNTETADAMDGHFDAREVCVC